MAEQVTIERRFRGPEESGNGGYACGTLARFVDPRAAEVTLRLPPPLGEDGAVAPEIVWSGSTVGSN